jgi:hypothetical protein
MYDSSTVQFLGQTHRRYLKMSVETEKQKTCMVRDSYPKILKYIKYVFGHVAQSGGDTKPTHINRHIFLSTVLLGRFCFLRSILVEN